jgi:nitric oxide synthase-interacting protein
MEKELLILNYNKKNSGSVVTAEAVEKIIRRDMIDPVNGKKCTESDFIPIQRGGTGFSGSGVKLNAKKIGPALIS